eukprot:TRINITY_DN12772_c0_g1_i2.p1 TRINITY_DN12772_c0_g1~~TRINITY_DN12772_c0_g1_i2.p1  ORF type:complete len:308 (+),score=36.41 TRINITY_DN12772_c0_g1_i2:68-991(+)
MRVLVTWKVLLADLWSTGFSAEFLASSRALEFEALVHADTMPCEPADQSSLWSCVRRVPDEDLKGFIDRNGTLCKRGPDRGDGVCHYGLSSKEEAAPYYQVGDIENTQYSWQIPRVPRVSKGPGFLKMNMTHWLQRWTRKFWEMNRNSEAMASESVVAGGFLNNHRIPTSLLSLDKFIEFREQIAREMQTVLQWWTERPLHSEAVYGVRAYHRGSMLLNHVDAHHTHVASAVLQVAQEVDMDGGWPLEVVAETGSVYEVYLQPGEMVLYEGAKLMHGRPMRFRGDWFANIFAHTRPLEWKGANVVEL